MAEFNVTDVSDKGDACERMAEMFGPTHIDTSIRQAVKSANT